MDSLEGRFELIDLYTPTVDSDKYIKYMQALVRAITTTRDGQREIRHRWPKPRPSRDASDVCRALRAEAADAEVPADVAVEAIYSSWLAAQLKSEPVAADEAGCTNEISPFCGSTSETQLQGIQMGLDLTLSGFVEGCAKYLPALADPPLDEDGARRRIDLFKRFDVDGTGLVSLSNFKAVVLEDTPSTWLQQDNKTKSGKKGIKGMTKKVTAVARLSKLSATASKPQPPTLSGSRRPSVS